MTRRSRSSTAAPARTSRHRLPGQAFRTTPARWQLSSTIQDAPRGTFTHWILYGLPPSTSSLDENTVPAEAKQAKNSAGRAAYAGPCPPSGTHHYRFTVFALDEPLDLSDGADTDEALDAISEHAVAQGQLVGLFTAR